MTAQVLREFINRHLAAATGLSALGAALDAHVTGTPLDPALEARVRELLESLGGADALAGLSPKEAAPFLAEIRHQVACNDKLLYAESRATSWSYADRRLLQEIGDFARSHATGLTRNVVPTLEGLSARFALPSASFLDIGVGVAGTAIGMAELWPQLHVVGLDVWAPSLELARENVARAGLRDRIELREQSAEKLEDDRAFDLAWMPIIFMPEQIIPGAVDRTHRALRTGGWVALSYANVEGKEPPTAAFWRLRTTTWGGPLWLPGQVEAVLRERGFVDVKTLPSPPGVAVALTVGRRAEI